jgi:flagella basal body P-ring formation protein FlgA
MVKSIRIIAVLICFLALCLSAEAKPAAAKDVAAAGPQNSQSITEGKLREVYIQYLCRRMGKERADVAVSKFKVYGNKPVADGKISMQLFQKNSENLDGYVKLVAVISVNQTVRNKVKLSGWVDVFESIVCAARNLKRKEIIKADDVYLARRNISHGSNNYLTDIGKVTGLMAKHSIKADKSIKEWMLERSPVVNKGDLVMILAESSGLRITVPGKVLMKGFAGELVKVQNLMSKRKIYAKIVNPSTVTVDF